MTSNRNDPQIVEAEIAKLADLDLTALRERWHDLFGHPPPKTLRQAFLVKACAHELQVAAFGGLSAASKRQLRAAAEAARTGGAILIAPRIKPGTQLVRAWRGKTETVTVLDDGFEWSGGHYGSLSVIAKAITGTNWNGPLFFGLKRVPVANKNGAGPRSMNHG